MTNITNNRKKCIAFTAIISTVIAGLAFLVARFHSKNKLTNNKSDGGIHNGIDDEIDDDFDSIDFDSIHNDIPRDYVSIKINNNKNQ